MHIIGTFAAVLTALWVWSWLQQRKRAKTVRRAMEMLHPDPKKYPRDNRTSPRSWIDAGNAEYPDFTERCNVLAGLGANENSTFMQTIDKLDHGHHVVAALSKMPELAIQILKFPPTDLAKQLGLLDGISGAACLRPR